MNRDDIQLLLITKIPMESHKQTEILETFRQSFKSKCFEDLFTLIRASYIGIDEMPHRKTYYLEFSKILSEQIRKEPLLATGKIGIYLGFISDDLIETGDPELVQAGQALGYVQRMVNYPELRLTDPVEISAIPAMTLNMSELSVNIEQFILKLLELHELFSVEPFKSLTDTLQLTSHKPPFLRTRAKALSDIGSFFEKSSRKDWALGCFHAAARIDPSFDIPWALLAHCTEDAKEGLFYANKAIILNPKCALAFLNRGLNLSKLGRFKEAAWDFAAVAKYHQDDFKPLLLCAQTFLEAGDAVRAVRLNLYAARRFKEFPELWHNLAEVFWATRIPDMAIACQERFRRLSHGEVPKERRLFGRLAVVSKNPGVKVKVDSSLDGETPVEFSDLYMGEHRVAWEGGPKKKVVLDEGESVRVFWGNSGDDVTIEGFAPEPNWWCVGFHEGEPISVSSRDLLAQYVVANIDDLPQQEALEAILKGVRKPLSPFSNEGRLTVEVVFKILLDEIVADGFFDDAEKENLRAIRERLLIPESTYETLYNEALEKAKTQQFHGAKGPPLNARLLYSQLYLKALEDGVLEPSEKEILSSVAEALLLDAHDVQQVMESIPKNLFP